MLAHNERVDYDARAMLESLERLVLAESPSLDKALCDACAEEVADLFIKRTGGRVVWHRNPERGDVLEVRVAPGEGRADPGEAGDRGRRGILILCHHDTVWDAGTIERLPFRVDGDRVTGPGSYDMKAGIVETAFALERARPRLPVTVLSTPDEEIGSGASRALIEDRARESVAVLVLEPATSGGAIKTARKGIADYVIRVHGRAAHAGVEPEKGLSAVEEMARIVLKLKALADRSKGTTINIGVVRGGTRPNVVAARADAEVDVRFAVASEMERVLPAIQALKPELDGVRIEVEGGLDRPPMERSEGVARLAGLAQQIAGELGFELRESSTGGGSDGNFTAALGVPSLDGLGPDGGGAHADSEHLLVSSWIQRTQLLQRLLERLPLA